MLTEAYGDAVGFHYSEAEDQGVFWSNDPHHPVGSMLEELGLEYAHKDVNIRTGSAEEKAQVLALNPKGKIPVPSLTLD